MRIRAIRTTLAALALLAAIAPAHAQFRGAAASANLSYTLSDLAPADGIAPSAVFGIGKADFREGLFVQPDGEASQYFGTEKTVTAPWTINHDVPEAHTATAYLGTGTIAAAVLAPSSEMTVIADQRVNALQEFLLAPHTSITFTLDAAVDLAVDLTYRAIQDASASVDLYVDGMYSPQPSGQSQGGSLYGAVSNDPDSRHPGFVPTVDKADTLRGTWTNDSDQWLGGRLYVNSVLFAWTRNAADVAPIPEPSEWAMLGVGVGLLGMRVRRKKAST